MQKKEGKTKIKHNSISLSGKTVSEIIMCPRKSVNGDYRYQEMIFVGPLQNHILLVPFRKAFQCFTKAILMSTDSMLLRINL